MKVSIIGTASEKGGKLSKRKWRKMIKECEKYITENITDDWSNIKLISGGAAWCDHIAVYLYKKHPESKLVLHIPCKWNDEEFYDNGEYHWAKNPGKLANAYHVSFSQKIGRDTLKDIKKVIILGAKVKEYNGFHKRNVEVGKCHYLIAFSYSNDDDIPQDGGTSYTWNKSISPNKKHFNIANI